MKDSNLNGDGPRLSLHKLAEDKPKDTLGEAAAFTRMGLALVPNEGKSPLLKGWGKRRLTREELPRYFNNGQNIGVVNGQPSGGLVTVDMDVTEALKIYEQFLRETLRSGRESTPGAHAWYHSPGAKTRKYQDTDGKVLMEMRSDGCQTLLPSSVHPNGEVYGWDYNGVQEPAEITPEGLTKHCTELATATILARHMPPVGGRHEYAKAAIGFLMRRLDRETTLKITRAAWEAADAATPEALEDLEGIAKDTERRLSEGENVFGAPALSETVQGLGELLSRWWKISDEGQHAESDEAVDDDGVPTQDELRDHWIETRQCPTAYGQGKWHRYGKGYWAPVHEQVINLEIDGILVDAKPEGIRPTAGMRGSVERLARSKTFVPDEVWDANPDILVCRNGTLEISSFKLREHSPEDYALSAVPFAYDSEAKAPTWSNFIASTIPNAENFLQEFAGYSLTVDTLAEIAVWLYGPPGCGKSTFIEGVKAMLGPRAGLLGLADIQRSRFALSKLPGKTLVTATEQPSDYLASTDVLNAIISGEEVQVEEKFKPSYTVIPRAKLLWAMNELPRVGDANSGLFRRVKVVKFPRLRGEPDPRVKEAIKQEGAGILNWALEGLQGLRERGGFEIPEAVQEATEDFKRTNDVPAAFVVDACITGDPAKLEEQAQDLYKAYQRWCRESGHRPVSMTRVAREWERLGFEKKSRGGRAFWRGIQVDKAWISDQENYPRT